MRGGGEMNVSWMLQTTRPLVDWKILAIDPDSRFRGTFIPRDLPIRDLEPTPHNLPSVQDVTALRESVGEATPVVFTANDLRTLGLMTILHAMAAHNNYFLWQCMPKRPDVKDPKRRVLLEMRNRASARMASHHLTFSPACLRELADLGVPDARLHLIPQLLNTQCDRRIRTDDGEETPFRDPARDALRILVVSRVTKTKGIHMLPAFLAALDARARAQGVGMSVTLMGNASNGPESQAIINDLHEVQAGLDNVHFEYTGYQPAEEVYRRMAEHDMALSLAGTEGYSVSLIEGLNMGLPHAVQPICSPNVDVVNQSGGGWILSGNTENDAAFIGSLRHDSPCLLDRRTRGYAFVDRTTGHERFKQAFMEALFSPRTQ